MVQSIWQDIQQQFRFGNRVTQIILVNVAVFIVIRLAMVLLQNQAPDAYATGLHFFSVSKDWWHNLTHPWSFLTYAFLHEGFMHILFNMLIFYWFGRIVGDLIGDQKILPLYVWGAIAGGVVYFATAALFGYGLPGQSFLIGASASVMAMVVAAAMLAPEYSMRLLLLGEVRLKYIALGIILLDVLQLGLDGNTGGHFAHFGGMAMGYVFVQQLREGNDLADPVNRAANWITGVFSGFGESRKGRRTASRSATRTSDARSPRPTMAARLERVRKSGSKQAPPPPPREPDSQERLDVILDKIKASGIDSLTDEEREFLSLASRNP